MTLDADQGTLEFDINDRCISERFADLPRDTPLFPTITAVYGNSEISIIYRGRPIIG
jgi:F-box protein 45